MIQKNEKFLTRDQSTIHIVAWQDVSVVADFSIKIIAKGFVRHFE
jgi:hypothetical protein